MAINKHDQQQAQQQRVMRKAKEQQTPIGAHPSTIVQRAISDPSSLTSGDVLQLQRTIGNQRTIQLLRGNTNVVQRADGGGGGMVVTPHNDAGEQEADLIANQVMDNISRKVDIDSDQSGMNSVQRSTEGVIQRGGPSIGLEGGEVSNDVSGMIESVRGTGSPVPDTLQRAAHSAGSPSMSGGEVVRGPKVDKILDNIGGIAATSKNTMMFHSKAPSFDTDDGKRLALHENVHRHQQGSKF